MDVVQLVLINLGWVVKRGKNGSDLRGARCDFYQSEHKSSQVNRSACKPRLAKRTESQVDPSYVLVST